MSLNSLHRKITIISSEWQGEVAARRCAEMRALAINLAEATVLTTGTYPQKAVRLHELNDRLQTKIELMQIGPSGRTLDHCSFNAGGKTYNAVPWRQNKKNRPNWTIEIQHRATEERPP